MDTLDFGDQIVMLIRRLTGEDAMLDLGWPQPFTGSAEQRLANRRSHRFDAGPDARCQRCDCRAGSVTSEWPCGVEPPRMHRDGSVSMSVSGCDLLDMMAEGEEREPGGLR